MLERGVLLSEQSVANYTTINRSHPCCYCCSQMPLAAQIRISWPLSSASSAFPPSPSSSRLPEIFLFLLLFPSFRAGAFGKNVISSSSFSSRSFRLIYHPRTQSVRILEIRSLLFPFDLFLSFSSFSSPFPFRLSIPLLLSLLSTFHPLQQYFPSESGGSQLFSRRLERTLLLPFFSFLPPLMKRSFRCFQGFLVFPLPSKLETPECQKLKSCFSPFFFVKYSFLGSVLSGGQRYFLTEH